jgi:hypothetical protein
VDPTEIEKKLKAVATPSCHECFGRGFIGVIHETRNMIACQCVVKKVKLFRAREILKPWRIRLRDFFIQWAKAEVKKIANLW